MDRWSDLQLPPHLKRRHLEGASVARRAAGFWFRIGSRLHERDLLVQLTETAINIPVLVGVNYLGRPK